MKMIKLCSIEGIAFMTFRITFGKIGVVGKYRSFSKVAFTIYIQYVAMWI